MVLITSMRTAPVVILQRDSHPSPLPTDAGVPSSSGEALPRDEQQAYQPVLAERLL
jgi:hypothetical protein